MLCKYCCLSTIVKISTTYGKLEENLGATLSGIEPSSANDCNVKNETMNLSKSFTPVMMYSSRSTVLFLLYQFGVRPTLKICEKYDEACAIC